MVDVGDQRPAGPAPLRTPRPELAWLGWLAGIAAGLWGFVRLADEMVEGDTHAFDRMLLLALRNPANHADPIGPPWLEICARDLTSLGGIPVLTLVTLCATGFLLVVRKRNWALLLLIAVGGGMLLGSELKELFDRPRPDLVPHAVQVYTLSFPSSHAMLSAVTYLTLAALLARSQSRRRVKAYLLGVAILLTLLIGSSRVYLGVHWPTDVLAGWCAGATWAMGCWMLALALQRRGAVEAESKGG
ncbi:MAG: phosphatase PAP2 family protein [Rhodospirillales bacterium]|nr:phosphatase PAP2 family protein [Rhodospirillales bacterium]